MKIEENSPEDEDEGAFVPTLSSYTEGFILVYLCLDAVLIDLPMQRPETYAFSVPLSSIYSFVVHPPNLSSWRESFSVSL